MIWKYLNKCKLFGHKPVNDVVHPEFNDVQHTSDAHCERCDKDMIGWYHKGEHSGEWMWVYVPASRELAHNTTRKKMINRNKALDKLLK